MTNHGELSSLSGEAPRPGIWSCSHCDCRVQIIVDPTHIWLQPFRCVCGNLMEAAEVHEADVVRRSHCAHCRVQIVDESTAVERDGERFCCPNCAAAVDRAHDHAGIG
jgi:hypothetical protein